MRINGNGRRTLRARINPRRPKLRILPIRSQGCQGSEVVTCESAAFSVVYFQPA